MHLERSRLYSGRMVRRWLRELVAFGFVAVFVACTTYSEGGESSSGDVPLPGRSDGGSGGDDSSTPAQDGSTDPRDSAAPHDAGPDAPSYADPCPPCSASSTCIAAGCNGDGTYNACSKPFDVTAPMSVVAFVCPEGSTVNFPQACVPGGGTKDLHVAVFRMGTSPAASGAWKVTVKGSNSFVSTGDCSMVKECAGGTDGPSTARTVAALATAMIGTTNPLTTCQQLMITFDK